MEQIHEFHNFQSKLTQASLLPTVIDYVKWQTAVRTACGGQPAVQPPDAAPISINLDLTTACNYRCDHCIDWDILNTKHRHDEETLRSSIITMVERGLRSVILIGGGEPTIYPG